MLFNSTNYEVGCNKENVKGSYSNYLRVYNRVSSRFFDQPGHEKLKRSMINHHFIINTYHPTRHQNQ